jgi:hypothetical protein
MAAMKVEVRGLEELKRSLAKSLGAAFRLL